MELDDSKLLETLIEIKSQLAGLISDEHNLMTLIQNHESRIGKLENEDRDEQRDSFKTCLLQLLAKCLVVALTVICTLTGSGALLTKMFGN